jgi:diguanylate cyclase (GGDEF)-like protein/PAS domain S-box-containing protein
VLRVAGIGLGQLDLRIVLFAVLIAAAGAFTAMQASTLAQGQKWKLRTFWLVLAGTSAGAGIWATHFLAIRAYQWEIQPAYSALGVALSFLVAASTAAAGFALAAPGSRWHAAAGGSVIGVAIVLTHVLGLKALGVGGTLHRSPIAAIALHVTTVALSCGGMLIFHELKRRTGMLAAAALLVLAVCGLHFAGVAMITVVPDPALLVPADYLSGPTLAIVVACVTALTMIVARVATLVSAQSVSDAASELRHRHELLRQREEALSKQILRFDMALSSMPHGLCMVDAERRLVVCNKRYADMYGLPAELTKPGTHISALLDHRIANGIYTGGDAQAYREERLRPIARTSIKTYQLNGGRTVLVTRRPTADGGWVAIHEDITEQRRLQETEREAKETLAAVFNAVPAAIICVAPDRRVMLWSRGAEHIFGYTSEEVIGQPYKLVPPEGWADFERMFERALAGETMRDVHVRRRRKNGSLVDIKFSSAAMREHDGTVRGIVYAVDDVTERERLNARLKAQNDLLTQREERLQAQNEQLDAALANMVQGLAMFDGQERLVLANDRYAELNSLSPSEIKPGTTLQEIIELRVARGLCPGMSAEQVLSRMRQRIACGKASYLVSPCEGRLVSASIQPRTGGGWVVTLHDISEQERLKKQVEAQNEVLDAALNNMSQGLAMFDSEQRLVLCNRLYGEMYGLTPEHMRPGITVRQTIEYRLANGCYAVSDPEAFVDALAKRFGSLREDTHRLADGRVIHVTYRRMANGGHVVTHEDVTARERLSGQLKEQNELLSRREEELKTRNMQLDAALEHMLQGLAMFDSEQRLVVCNRLYAEMYGLTPEQVKPGTTVRQIFDYRLANGFYHVKDTEAFVESWASNFGQRSARIQELADGRVISVARGQTADGGRVVTHEDITARQKLTAQLEQQHQMLKAHEERLQEQNMQLDAALNNMVQGLAMFDGERRIVIANKRYAELYGLSDEQVKPGTHLRQIIEFRIANGDLAGKSADQVMEAMLARIEGNGECQYTTRLSDGRYISVSAKPMRNGYTVTTHQDITEQRHSEAKIVHMAMHDALTGLPNRVLFNERLEQALARVNRGDIAAVHLLDLDHFKNVNDTLGHPAGDKLLKAVTGRLRTLVRETDTVARMGGDEFAILQMAIAQPADASSLARRVIETLSEPYEIEGHQVVIGASVGIAVGPSDGKTSDQLIRNADLALYRAKGDGRGAFSFFEPHMDAQMQERRSMEYDMRKALTAGEFELFYQPVVNLATNEVNGCEALIRWRHPDKGLVPPSAFIPLAEEIGFIVPLGDWVIREACATAARWPEHVKIAVNLSPVQFRSAGLMQTVVGALAASGLAPGRLELEITETILLQDSEATLAILYQLRELGVRIAMDDFGTGYSSLSYLQSFPFDRIKIDRSFIKDIGDGVGSLNIVRAVAALATGLGMETTAEGVETEQQRETVRSEGCTEMQGYLFSRPLPSRDIERLYFAGLEGGAAAADEATGAPATVARATAR